MRVESETTCIIPPKVASFKSLGSNTWMSTSWLFDFLYLYRNAANSALKVLMTAANKSIEVNIFAPSLFIATLIAEKAALTMIKIIPKRKLDCLLFSVLLISMSGTKTPNAIPSHSKVVMCSLKIIIPINNANSGLMNLWSGNEIVVSI